MSFATKTLKTSDITVFPYEVNKTYTLASSSFASYGITIVSGSNIAFNTTGSYPQLGINYRSARHLYYSNKLSSLAPSIPLSEQDAEQLAEDQTGNKKVKTSLIYDNFLQSTAASGSAELDDRLDFPTASNAQIKILSIPTSIYGELIKPGSFSIKETGSLYNIVDDGNGNLYQSGSTIHVGNIIYPHGLAVITNTNYLNFNTSSYTLTLQNQVTIYETQIRCHVNENEFNVTQNPSAVSGSTGSLADNVTGSYFNPYATTVGLYNAANELLAVGKLAQPYPIPTNTDITFVVKYDT